MYLIVGVRDLQDLLLQSDWAVQDYRLGCWIRLHSPGIKPVGML